MSYLSDTLTVGLILVLVFGSIALYLYTRVQQTEQKVNLLESIVLDLKLTGEIPSFSTPDPFSMVPSAPSAPPAPSAPSAPSVHSPTSAHSDSLPLQEYKPFDEDAEVMEVTDSLDALDSSMAHAEPLEPLEPVEKGAELFESVEAIPMSSYDHMSVKELQAEARTRGLSVEKGAKKQALIELLKKADAEAKPVSTSSLASLEPFPHDEE